MFNPLRACRAGHPRAATRGSIFQSTKSFTTSAGASRVSRYRTNRSLRPSPVDCRIKSGNDSTSKHNLDRRKQWSNAASGTRCFQLAARLPCRSSPTLSFFCHPRVPYFFILSSPGLTRGSTFQSTKSFTTSAGASRVSRYRTNRSLRPLPVDSRVESENKPECPRKRRHIKTTISINIRQ